MPNMKQMFFKKSLQNEKKIGQIDVIFNVKKQNTFS